MKCSPLHKTVPLQNSKCSIKANYFTIGKIPKMAFLRTDFHDIPVPIAITFCNSNSIFFEPFERVFWM